MNKLGERGEPFLFVIDYEMQAPLVYPLHSVPDYLTFDFYHISYFPNKLHEPFHHYNCQAIDPIL